MTRLTGRLLGRSTHPPSSDSFVVYPVSRQEKRRQYEILKKNRCNPFLEKAARKNQLKVSLSAVRSDWEKGRGDVHLQRSGEHFNIYSDLYKRVFRPLGFLGVTYDNTDIRRGNIVHPIKVLNEPAVTLPSDDKQLYWTLVMSNPDGHLTDSNYEVLHWMIGNIPVGERIHSGETVFPYLPPVPPQGTGVHRIIFSLYQHQDVVSFTSLRRAGSWLYERTFSTHQFLSSHSLLSPFTFCFFQTVWDKSVQETYHKALGVAEPVYEVKTIPTARQTLRKKIKESRSQYYRDLISHSH